MVCKRLGEVICEETEKSWEKNCSSWNSIVELEDFGGEVSVTDIRAG